MALTDSSTGVGSSSASRLKGEAVEHALRNKGVESTLVELKKDTDELVRTYNYALFHE